MDNEFFALPGIPYVITEGPWFAMANMGRKSKCSAAYASNSCDGVKYALVGVPSFVASTAELDNDPHESECIRAPTTLECSK